jgi:hypothetical protein
VAGVPSAELEKHPVRTPDPYEEPSVDWGWHGSFKVGTQIWGWFVVIACFGMFIGNQIGHIEDIFLGLTGLITLFLLLRDIKKRRTAWRR